MRTFKRFVILLWLMLALGLALPGRADAATDALPAALAVHALDYAQTLSIVDSCEAGGGFYETNSVLGRCPSKAEVGRYFAGTAVLGLVLHEVLPERYKPVLSYIWLAVGVGATAHNHSLGVRVKF